MTWFQRVSQYVDRLAEVADEMNEILDETRIRTIGLKPDEVDASTMQLATAITRLETLVQERDELIRAEDAPPMGLSLSEKLLSGRKIEEARLARRCGEMAEVMSNTHQRAVALFVCQYHLSELQTELLGRLSGACGPPTYAKGKMNRTSNGGGLFNEAA